MHVHVHLHVLNLSQELVLEKETRIREYMLMMGLQQWVLWTTWFIKQLLFLSTSTLVVTLLLKVCTCKLYIMCMYNVCIMYMWSPCKHQLIYNEGVYMYKCMSQLHARSLVALTSKPAHSYSVSPDLLQISHNYIHV